MFVLTDEERTARKFYHCDASEMWRSYGPPETELTADERLAAGRREGRPVEDQAGPALPLRGVPRRPRTGDATRQTRLMNNLCQKHDLAATTLKRDQGGPEDWTADDILLAGGIVRAKRQFDGLLPHWVHEFLPFESRTTRDPEARRYATRVDALIAGAVCA